ncbi:MAG: hypothetical protein IPL30_10130 [Elusimicrobia bacterium]|nr:hypothetical protein [Elusimicrobiota bacterium]
MLGIPMMGGSLGVGPVIEVAPVIHNITPPAGPMIEDLTPPPGPMPKPGKEPCDKIKVNGPGRNYSEGEGEDDDFGLSEKDKRKDREKKPNRSTPDENDFFDELSDELGLTKKQRRQLHDEIGHEHFSNQEIREIAKAMFGL